MPPTAYKELSVVFLTRDYSITGRLDSGNYRLSDLLNDPLQTILYLRDTSLARLSDPAHSITHHSQSTFPKASVFVAFEGGDSAQGEAERLYKYVHKEQVPLYLLLDGIEVRGFFHMRGSWEPGDLYQPTERPFIPLTNATLGFVQNRQQSVRLQALIVNLRHLSYVAIDGRETAGDSIVSSSGLGLAPQPGPRLQSIIREEKDGNG